MWTQKLYKGGKMEQLRTGTSEVYLDFMIIGVAEEPLIVSYYERSAQLTRAVGAALVTDGFLVYKHRCYKNGNKFTVHYATVQKGKEKFTHAIAISTNLTKDYLITTQADLCKDLYYMLMNTYDLPLLEWWIPELLNEMQKQKLLYQIQSHNIFGNRERSIRKNGENVPIRELLFFHLSLNEEILKKLITKLFQEMRIWITRKPQQELSIKNLDEYFQKYGKTIVNNLKEILEPVSGLVGKIDRAVLKTMRLYPQQAAMVNGVYEYFQKSKKNYVLFSMGTGSGKTIQAATAAEMLYVGKWLKEHPDKTLADAYAKDGVINYRHFIMCPGHLVNKWRKELHREIPYAKPIIVDNFEQLVKLRENGPERVNGKEYYIISKDFLKLSYQRIPTPKKEATRFVEVFKCKECGAIQRNNMGVCCACNSKNLQIVRTKYKRHGLICPNCNRLLFPMNFSFELEKFEDAEDENSWPFHWYDMVAEKNYNQNCIYCNENLWMPFVKNIDTEFGSNRQPTWIRQTFWANKAKKGKMTNWVMCGYEEQAGKLFGKVLNSMNNSRGGCRKYSPALYIKKYLKNYIDVFICDEVHKAKGGSTAQGNAFHHIMKVAKYTFGLTGTIAGGVATDLFYLLFRCEPHRMIEHGYTWNSIMRFAKDYGCVETEFSVNMDARMNVCSRGRQLHQPRVLAGISPLIFSEFLLDRAVFLNIEDMSANMPPLHEYIRLCDPNSEMEWQMFADYNNAIGLLKRYERKYKLPLTSVRNQFSMSYLDKPYGVEPILNPKTGEVVVIPKDYHVLVEDARLLAKEQMLVDIVNQELKEGRNCVIYAEYTQSDATNVLSRLHDILVKNCNLKQDEVVILRANYPSATAREEWMHKQAEKGMKIMLCNPRLCETGLDFCWYEHDVLYNYPTLIFHQSGYSLFIMWQAAGRAWRLNQREECRIYYLGYKKTVQQAILQVLGEKKAATSAIQGRFSADGLVAMASGVDTQVRIAQIMSEMDHQTENKLQEMFDVITGEKENAFGDEQTMMLFNEIVDEVEELGMELNIDSGTSFDIFKDFMSIEDMNMNRNLTMFSMMIQFDELMEQMDSINSKSYVPAKKRKRKAKVYENCSLFI